MRINSVRPSDEVRRARAEDRRDHAADRQRPAARRLVRRDGARARRTGQEWYRFTWHDRKAWWQQEQAILAYLILAGILGDEEYRTEARYAAAFYNAWFLDHDAGAVYFNVLASGMPYLLGTERLKGSHSMSAYHNTELCYLAAVYTNLLITKQPLDLHFKPRGDAFKDRILRVSPDILPPGSIRIDQVWIDGQPWSEFDAEQADGHAAAAGQGRRGEGARRLGARDVRERGAGLRRHRVDHAHRQARRDGAGDARARPASGRSRASPQRVVLRAEQLESMSSAGARALLFLRQKLPFEGVEVVIVGAKPEVQEACRSSTPRSSRSSSSTTSRSSSRSK